MITEATTTVYVRVDLASNRVVGLSDEILVSREGKPVFKVTSNQANLDYYIIEKHATATHGITVRPATAAERTAADAVKSAKLAKSISTSKAAKAVQLKNYYDNSFIRRFYARGFYTTLETLAAADYTGTDSEMLANVKPLGIKINNAYCEWRHVVCQPVIDDMFASEGFGPDLEDMKVKEAIETALDAFLTARDFSLTEFGR